MSENEALLCPKKAENRDAKDTLLFVCTGNTCRSPMAQALFNHIYDTSPYRAVSAGLAADGSPISESAKQALMERGVLPTPDNDYLHHTSRMLCEDILKDAALVVAVSASHAMSIIMRYPAHASKVTVMPSDISDPYGGDIDCYRRCLADIEAALAEAFIKENSEAEDEH